jgi:ankyrin repeat protein
MEREMARELNHQGHQDSFQLDNRRRLGVAILASDEEAVRLLLNSGIHIDINTSFENGQTPLQLALHSSPNDALIKLLLDAGAGFNNIALSKAEDLIEAALRNQSLLTSSLRLTEEYCKVGALLEGLNILTDNHARASDLSTNGS